MFKLYFPFKNETRNYSYDFSCRKENKMVISHMLSDNGIDVITVPEWADFYKIDRRKIFFSKEKFRGYKNISGKPAYVKIESEKHCYTICRGKEWLKYFL